MLPFGFGTTELLIILGIAVIILGPKKLPDVGRSLGRATRDFRSSVGEIDEIKDSLKVDVDLDLDGKKAARSGDGKKAKSASARKPAPAASEKARRA